MNDDVDEICRETDLVPRKVHFASTGALRKRGYKAISRIYSEQDEDDSDSSRSKRFQIHPEMLQQLKPYQKEAVWKVVDRCCRRDTGVLLDFDMGTGKTFTSIAVIHTAANDRKRTSPLKSMVLCPAGGIDTWNTEFQKWIPKASESQIDVIPFKATDYVNGEREDALRSFLSSQNHSVLIMGYELYRSMTKQAIFAPYLQNPGPEFLFLDEAQRIKNHKTITAKAVARIVTNKRIALTGTPIHNTLRDLHNVVENVNQDALGPREEFCELVSSIEGGACVDASVGEQKVTNVSCNLIGQVLEHFTLRAESQLSATIRKTDTVIYIKPAEAQCFYYGIILEMFNNKTLRKNVVATNHLFIRLFADVTVFFGDIRRKLLDSHYQENPFYTAMALLMYEIPDEMLQLSNKIQLLSDIILSCNGLGDKIVVFSQNKDTLAFLQKVVEIAFDWRENVHFNVMTGDVPLSTRKEIIDNFNNEENTTTRLLLLTTKANGTAITLVGANRVIEFDVTWTASDDNQAVDRVYRFNQKKPVYVYRFVTKGTAEEVKFKRNINKELISTRVRNDRYPSLKNTSEELTKWFEQYLREDSNEPLMRTDDEVMNALIEKHPKAIPSYCPYGELVND